MARMPSLFVSHGAPTMIIQDGPAHRFLAGYSEALGKPSAILVASAHWESADLLVSTAEKPETIYDFHGFPKALYEFTYAAPGAPAIAARATELLRNAGLKGGEDPGHGLDHGAWAPLQLMYPDADIPVAQISIQTRLGPARQLAVGRALAPLRDEGVLIMGSGTVTHNLAEFRGQALDAPPPDWVTEFADWTHAVLSEGRTDDLLNYRAMAPHADRNHPTEEHFLPLITALGAGGPEARAERVHASTTFGVLAMDAYAFS
ncbi:MAG: DODA-type extradiol aromatic ring-opening family dioxygenase [Alphaproteobacteria bacterium]